MWKRNDWSSAVLALGFVVFCSAAPACPLTPLDWQQEVRQHSNAALVGQRKHTTWSRDQNRNFIDDELDANAKPTAGARVDVTVDIGTCLPAARVEQVFAPYGRINYVGELITFVLLDDVLVTDLPRLAELPEVAMVEKRSVVIPTIDVASRAVEARRSVEFAGISAEDQGVTGAGVTIAFIGTGITSSAFSQLSGKLVAGYDATDPNDPGNGKTDPTDTLNFHESVMATLAVGARVSGQTCRAPTSGTGVMPDCAGIAPDARYVNVRQCVPGGTCTGYEKAVDWVGRNASKFGIKVVSMAFSRCADVVNGMVVQDDGTGAQAQQANYLVGMGLVVVAAASRNPQSACTPPGAIGDRIVRSPGTASFPITVTASNGGTTVVRSDDTTWSSQNPLGGFTIGPRTDWNAMAPDFNALKPDVTVHAQGLEIFRTAGQAHLAGVSGTSPATAIVSGMAALILSKYPQMTPDSVKQLLISTTDRSRNTTPMGLPAGFDPAFGWGFARVGTALQQAATQQTDLAFPNCAATGNTSGQICNLANGQPAWNNDVDISTTSQPTVGASTTVQARVTNRGNNPANATVNFGVMIFNAGIPQFHAIGSQQITLAANGKMTVSQPWTPRSTDHTCAQVSISFGRDSDYTNNLTQRNLQIAPSVFRMKVNNPDFVPAHFEVQPKSTKPGWVCKVDQPAFDLDPFKDCPRDVTITFDAPAGAAVGERANCDVSVFSRPDRGEKKLIGGVTVVTYVPKPCKVQGLVVDTSGQPLVKARVAFAASRKGEKHAGFKPSSTESDENGVFTLETLPDVEQELHVETKGGPAGALTLRPLCGPSLPRVVVGKDRLKLDYAPPIVVEEVTPIRFDGGAPGGPTPPGDGGTSSGERRGCGCRVPGRGANGAASVALLVAALALVWRRRRSSP